MASVTEVASRVKQPRGGFVKLDQFKVVELKNESELQQQSFSNAGTVGATVDYLTRYLMGAKKVKAFEPSCKGASYAKRYCGYDDAVEVAKSLLRAIKGADETSVECAYKMASFDAYYRATGWAVQNKYNAMNITIDVATISDIQIMVERSLDFWKEYGPIVKDGFTFGPTSELDERQCFYELMEKGIYGGYTSVVTCGDGDYLTKDTLWDFKVSKNKPMSKHILQILMYWIMGIHSGQDEFKGIERLGFYNPRMNVAYILQTKNISQETIEIIENDIIGYEKSKQLAKLRKTKPKTYRKGDIVEHKVFGRGTVLKVKPAAGDQIVEINFEKVGIKKTMANFAPLTKITEEE